MLLQIRLRSKRLRLPAAILSEEPSSSILFQLFLVLQVAMVLSDELQPHDTNE
jgi:hypothetical protein